MNFILFQLVFLFKKFRLDNTHILSFFLPSPSHEQTWNQACTRAIQMTTRHTRGWICNCFHRLSDWSRIDIDRFQTNDSNLIWHFIRFVDACLGRYCSLKTVANRLSFKVYKQGKAEKREAQSMENVCRYHWTTMHWHVDVEGDLNISKVRSHWMNRQRTTFLDNHLGG